MNSIAYLRKSQGMTQDQLAERMGFSGAGRRLMIQRWEHGKGISTKNAKKTTVNTRDAIVTPAVAGSRPR